MFYLVLALFNFAVYYLLFSSRDLLKKLGPYRFTIFLSCSIILTSAQLAAFLHFKEKNFYELHNKPRESFEHLSLDEAELLKPKIPAQARPTSQDQLGSYILSYSGLRVFYDRFGNNFIDAIQRFDRWGPTKYFIFEKSALESIGFYFGAILVGVYLSVRYKSNSLKKWNLVVIIACFFLEIDIWMESEPKEGILGQYVPNLAGFERIQLFKILVICIGNALRAYYAYFKITKIDKMDRVFLYVSSFNSYLSSLIGEKERDTKNEIVSSLNNIKTNSEVISKYVENEKKYKDEQRLTVVSPKKPLILYLVIASLYYLPMVQEYFFDGNKYGAYVSEDYIKL